jgi:ferrous iron transport protein A
VDCYPLELLSNGQEARIVDICGDSQQVHRLAEIGIRLGSALRMIRCGQPCLLSVDGRRLSLRLNPSLIEIFVASSSMAQVSEAV